MSVFDGTQTCKMVKSTQHVIHLTITLVNFLLIIDKTMGSPARSEALTGNSEPGQPYIVNSVENGAMEVKKGEGVELQ